jgi:hypothetical protein
MKSAAPPGGTVTMSLIGRLGYAPVSCAWTQGAIKMQNNMQVNVVRFNNIQSLSIKKNYSETVRNE